MEVCNLIANKMTIDFISNNAMKFYNNNYDNQIMFKQLSYTLKKCDKLNLENEIVVYIRCPISHKKLNKPSRSIICEHYECMNLEDYIYYLAKTK